jgi:hypothetical protein
VTAEWYLLLEGVERGAFTASKLKELAREGTITPDTTVKKGAEGNWVRASRVKGLFEEVVQPEVVQEAPRTDQPQKANGLRKTKQESTFPLRITLISVAALSGVVLGILGTIALLLLVNETGRGPRATPNVVPRRQPGEWYSGGTLHDATIREWYAAQYSNRVATCADFLVAKDPSLAEDMDELKSLAIRLDKAIRTAGRHASEDQNVAEICAMLFVLWDRGYEL